MTLLTRSGLSLGESIFRKLYLMKPYLRVAEINTYTVMYTKSVIGGQAEFVTGLKSTSLIFLKTHFSAPCHLVEQHSVYQLVIKIRLFLNIKQVDLDPIRNLSSMVHVRKARSLIFA